MGKKNHISLVDLLTLQFLWIFQSVCENILSVFKRDFWSHSASHSKNTKTFHEKRHFIQLYTVEPKRIGDRPICYMNVTEFDSSQEEEIRRRNSSNDAYKNKTFLRHNGHVRSRSEDDLQKFYCSSIRF